MLLKIYQNLKLNLQLKMTKIIIIRLRGSIGINRDIRDTLNFLKLFNKNYCVIINNNPNQIGMLSKIKDYVTWGELDNDTFMLLIKERGRIAGNKKLTEEYLKQKNIELNNFAKDFFNAKKSLKDVPGLKQFFRLKPPVHGFEVGGIKRPYSLGGSLGYRKNNINELIQRMI